MAEQNLPPRSSERREPAKKVEKKDETRVKRVTTSEAAPRKKSLFRKTKEAIFGIDTKSALEYMIFEVAIPAARDLIVDAGKAGLERRFYGEVRHSSRRGYRDHTPYHNMSRPGPRDDPRDRGLDRRSRSVQDFREYDLGTRIEAEQVITELDMLIEEYGAARVSDYYNAIGVTANPTDEKYGWTDLRAASVSRTPYGRYAIELPRAEALR